MAIDTTEIVAGIALSGVVFSALLSAFISFRSSAKSVYINSVTQERMKWIEKLRDLIVGFNTSLFKFMFKTQHDKTYFNKGDFFSDISEHHANINSIIVHLNNRGVIEDNVVRLAKSCYFSCLEAAQDDKNQQKSDKFMKYSELLAEHASFLFKQEWERVKIEASQPIYALYLKKKAARRLSSYIVYSETRGFFEDGYHPQAYAFTPPHKMRPFFRSRD